MSRLFVLVFNMSITASYVVPGLLFLRLLLNKLPKIYSYALWSAVWIRLVLPFSLVSAFSFLYLFKPTAQGGTITYLPYPIGPVPYPKLEMGPDRIDPVVNALLPAATVSANANPMQLYLFVLSGVWALGVIALLGYGVISYLKVAKNVRTATLIRDNIFETDRIDTPFVFGLIKPKIYLPVHIPANELPYILAHEQTHIRRLDYLVKPLSFLVLILHWFNPVLWLSFILMSRDMEMSCDESVIRKMGMSSKGAYSHSLLSFAMKRSGLRMGGPLAFGKNSIRSRVKNVLSYKKLALWAAALCMVGVVLLIAVLTSNPGGSSHSVTKAADSGYVIEDLINHQTPYVGDNSKVTALVDDMPWPKGMERSTVELQTAHAPYGMTIHLTVHDATKAVSAANAADVINAVSAANFTRAGIARGTVNGDAPYRNAVLLFSLIGNVDIIRCEVTDDTGRDEGVSRVVTFTRKLVEEWVGGDVRQDAASANALRNLLERVNKGLMGVEQGSSK